MTEKGSDELLPADYDPSAQIAADEAALAKEDARVETQPTDQDPGVEYPAPELPPDTGDAGGFDPLPS